MNETAAVPGFVTKRLGVEVDAVAPDGYDVRLLVNAQCGSCAEFELAPGQTGRAGAHRTVTEIWFITSGRGRMWRRASGHEEIVDLEPGVSVSIPVGTQFQSQAIGYEPLAAVGVTIPAWPGGDEWYEVDGKWKPTVQPQPQVVCTCREWSARYVRKPLANSVGKLSVSGQCTFPTSGYTVELRRHAPQGINPKYLLLDKIVHPPIGIVTQVQTVVPVEYSEATDFHYDFVTILPDTATIQVVALRE